VGAFLAQGTNLGAFRASSKSPFALDPAQARRFVIMKIEAYGPGVFAHPSGQYVMGFVTEGKAPPKRSR
jgi:hypothetical protein